MTFLKAFLFVLCVSSFVVQNLTIVSGDNYYSNQNSQYINQYNYDQYYAVEHKLYCVIEDDICLPFKLDVHYEEKLIYTQYFYNRPQLEDIDQIVEKNKKIVEHPNRKSDLFGYYLDFGDYVVIFENGLYQIRKTRFHPILNIFSNLDNISDSLINSFNNQQLKSDLNQLYLDIHFLNEIIERFYTQPNNGFTIQFVKSEKVLTDTHRYDFFHYVVKMNDCTKNYQCCQSITDLKDNNVLYNYCSDKCLVVKYFDTLMF
jgi:hypothetical protein